MTALFRFAKDHGIKNITWAYSTDSEVSHIFFGVNIASEVILQFDAIVPEMFPDIPVKLVSSETPSLNLSGRISEHTCNPFQKPITWECIGRPTSTCEVILAGHEPHKDGRQRLFAVTSAHLLLSKEEMLPFDSGDSDSHHLSMRALREEVNKRMDRHMYTLQLGQNFDCKLHLSHPPIFSYRYYKDANAENGHGQKQFMNDLAVFPIEMNGIRQLKESLVRPSCRLDSIRTLPLSLLQQMVQRSVRVFSKGREGKLKPMRQVLESGGPEIGYHLSFELTRG